MAQAQQDTPRSRRNGSARHALKARTEDVISDFTTLRKDVNRLANAAGEAARSEVRSTADRLQRIGGDLRARVDDGAGYVTEQVRTHPAAAVGLSLGAGLVLGLLLRRR